MSEEGQYPPQAECEHDWLTSTFDESPKFVRVCGWCGLGQGRDSEDGPWEFFTQMVGDGLRPRPPLRSIATAGDPQGSPPETDWEARAVAAEAERDSVLETMAALDSDCARAEAELETLRAALRELEAAGENMTAWAATGDGSRFAEARRRARAVLAGSSDAG